MATSVGTLTIDMAMNVAKIASDLDAVRGKVDSTMSGIVKSAKIAVGALGAIGVSLSSAAFASAIKGAIDYADHLNDLSKATGLTVETLDGLAYASKTAGTDLDGVAKNIGKLQKNLFEAAAGNKELATMFARMGVNAKEGINDTLGTFMKLVDEFEKMPAGAEKSAVAAKLFSKDFQSLLPLLAEGSDKLRELIAEQQRWGGVSTDTANRADAFNDTMEKLRMMSGAFMREVAAALLPTLQALANVFVDMKEKGGGFKEVASNINEALKFTVTVALSAKNIFDRLGSAVGGVAALVGAFFKGELFSGTGDSILEQMFQRDMELSNKLGEDLTRILGEAEGIAAPQAKKTGKNIAAEIAAGAKDGFGAILADLDKKLAGQTSPYNKEVAELEIRLREFERTNRKLTASEKELAMAKAAKLDLLRSEKMITEEILALNKEFDDAIAQDIAASEQKIKGLQDSNEMMRAEISLLGADEKARALRNNEIERERNLRDVIDVQQRDRINRLHDERAALIQMRDAAQETNTFWSQFSDLVAGAASALKGGFSGAVDYAKNAVKQLIAEMIALTAKRWVLNLAANATGSSQLANMAASQGQGTLSGNLLNTLMSGGGPAGSMLASVGGSIIGMGGNLMGGLGAFVGGIGELGVLGSMGASMSAGMTAIGAGNILGGIGSMLGPIGLAIGAIYALHKAFGDKGENWKGQLGFGSNANAYASSSVFGQQGFSNLQGNDATNRAIQAFMSGTGGIDTALARGLTADQISAISSRLSGYNRRTDGQPAEFAFSKDDQTASQQLTLEYLKVKYGTVFDEIDKTFADFIRGYTGKSEDLLAEIGKFAEIIGQIGNTKIKGLSVESIREMVGPNGDIGTALKSIVETFADMRNRFTSEGQKLAEARKLIESAFGSIGQAVPKSNEEFLALVNSIDLSTAAGRQLYSVLSTVAPSFQMVSQAAEAMANRFRSVIASIYGSSASKSMIESQAVGLISQFQAKTGLVPGSNPLDVFRSIGGLDAATMQYIFNTFGDDVDDLLVQILELYSQYMNLNDAASGLGTGFVDLGNVVSGVTDQMAGVKDGLRKWVDGLFVGPLSPLAPREQLAEAERQYRATLALAKGGDVSAAQNLQGLGQTYIELARQIYGSGAGYNAIFRDVATGVGNFAGYTTQDINARLASAIPAGATLATGDQMIAIDSSIKTLISLVASGISVRDEAVAELMDDVRGSLDRIGTQEGLLTQ